MKIGVLGSAGSIGSRHAANLETLGHQVARFDPAGQMDVRFERQVYDTCEAVVIATPSMFHQSAIRAAAERGKHIFVEKPLGTSNPDVYADVLAMAKRNGCAVMVGCNLRFHGCVLQAKRWLDAGEIGKPLWANFTCAQKNKRSVYRRDGVILNWGAHEIDLALHLFGPATLTAANSTEVDDIADLIIGHDSQVRTTVHLDYVTDPDMRFAIIGGDGGYISIDLKHRTSWCVVPDHRQFVPAPGSWDDDYVTEMNAFFNRCQGTETLGATADDGLAVMKLCLDARKMAGLPT